MTTSIVLLALAGAFACIFAGAFGGWLMSQNKTLRDEVKRLRDGENVVASGRLGYDELAAIEEIKAYRAGQRKRDEVIDELLAALRDGRFRRQD